MERIHATVFGTATERMLDLAEVRSGMHVLDVAAGAGGQTLLAAHRVGQQGQILAVDLSANMLEVAGASLREHGGTNAQTRVMDAQRLELEPDMFDAAISRLGIMPMAEPLRALTEIRRVLKPCSRLALMVWSTPENNPFMSMPFGILRQFGLLPLAPGLPGPYALGSPGVLEATCERAGFQDVAVETAALRWQFASVADALGYYRLMSTSLPREVTEQLNEEQGRQLTAELEQGLRRFERGDGIDLAGEALLGVGTK